MVARPNVDHSGAWEWRKSPRDETSTASMGFEARTDSDRGVIRLDYEVTVLKSREEILKESMSYPEELVSRKLPRGRPLRVLHLFGPANGRGTGVRQMSRQAVHPSRGTGLRLSPSLRPGLRVGSRVPRGEQPLELHRRLLRNHRQGCDSGSWEARQGVPEMAAGSGSASRVPRRRPEARLVTQEKTGRSAGCSQRNHKV